MTSIFCQHSYCVQLRTANSFVQFCMNWKMIQVFICKTSLQNVQSLMDLYWVQQLDTACRLPFFKLISAQAAITDNRSFIAKISCELSCHKWRFIFVWSCKTRKSQTDSLHWFKYWVPSTSTNELCYLALDKDR